MEIVAVVRSTGQRGVVLGSGYGQYAFQSQLPFWNVQQGERYVVAMCNEDGDVGLFDPADIQIVSIGGKPVSQILASSEPDR